MARDFYPFVEDEQGRPCEVNHPARIAVYDDAAAAPRVVVVEPSDPRTYLEEITSTVNRLSHEQGGAVPFMVIREIVENFIHAYFQSPTITILDGGNTIRFSDQGPGIKEKDLALEYGTSSATEDMKRYIRGVGSGLPYVQQYMADKGGSLQIEDNIAGGAVVTISTLPAEGARAVSKSPVAATPQAPAYQQAPQQQPWPGGMYQQAWPQQPQAWQQAPAPQPAGWPQAPAQQWAPQQQAPAYRQAPRQEAPAFQQPATYQQAPQPPAIDELAAKVLEYLSAHEQVGPTDLTRTYGSSSPTWSRKLQALSNQGVVVKSGQKYRLTDYGAQLA